MLGNVYKLDTFVDEFHRRYEMERDKLALSHFEAVDVGIR
jgi:hypothetical protein